MLCMHTKRIVELHGLETSRNKTYEDDENSFVLDLIDYAAFQGILKKTSVKVKQMLRIYLKSA